MSDHAQVLRISTKVRSIRVLPSMTSYSCLKTPGPRYLWIHAYARWCRSYHRYLLYPYGFPCRQSGRCAERPWACVFCQWGCLHVRRWEGGCWEGIPSLTSIRESFGPLAKDRPLKAFERLASRSCRVGVDSTSGHAY
jgi:hypothetical protein